MGKIKPWNKPFDGNWAPAEDKHLYKYVKQEVVKLIRPEFRPSDETIEKAFIKACRQANLMEWSTALLLSLSNNMRYCERCGACCRKCTNVRLEVTDIARIAQYLRVPIPEFYVRYTRVHEEFFVIKKDTPCMFLRGKNSCSIYPVRPEVCRVYPFNQTPESVNLVSRCGVICNLILHKTVAEIMFQIMPRESREEMEKYGQAMLEKYHPESFGDYCNMVGETMEKLGMF